ncbi:MAG: uroporphyrinogen decarboxylase family protein [Planctomycetota bacterium]
MTPRERWLAVLNRETPDRVPMDWWSTGEVETKIKSYLGCDTMDAVFERLHIDRPLTVGPKYVGPPTPPNTNEFGIRRRRVRYETGDYSEVVHHPLAGFESVEQIEDGYTWPSPDWWDYASIPDQVRGNEHRPIRGGGSEPFLTYKHLRGQEQAFIDLIENPEIVHYCLDRLFELCEIRTQRIYEQTPGQVMITYVAEDLGAQEGLMYSPDQIRTFFLPRMKRMMDLAHQAGAFVFHHDDGAVRDILPDLIDAGIDVLNPVQWRCKGMDREGLKRDFGDRIVFHGAMDNQYTLARGTVGEVRQEVRDNLRILGRGGGYILAPCHNIQPVSPPENIVAMYDTGYEEGQVT